MKGDKRKDQEQAENPEAMDKYMTILWREYDTINRLSVK